MQTLDRQTAVPLDILILLPRWNTGGVARTAWLLSDELVAGGLTVALAMLRPSRSGETMPATRAQSWTLGGKAGGVGWLAPLVLFLRLMRRARPSVLFSPGNHANLLTSFCHLFAPATTRLVIKITNPIEGPRHGPWRRRMRRNLYRLMFRRAHSVLVLSAEDADAVAALFPATAHKIRITANPYLPAVEPLEAGGAERDETPLILSVGRLTAQKKPGIAVAGLGARDRSAVAPRPPGGGRTETSPGGPLPLVGPDGQGRVRRLCGRHAKLLSPRQGHGPDLPLGRAARCGA